MHPNSLPDITFARLTDIAVADSIAHMSDPRTTEHLPLATFEWSEDAAQTFIAQKEACWTRDGLGHWAFLNRGTYVGWGGFQKEGREWDFGLVLTPTAFGLGMNISRQALAFARNDDRIPFVTFLLPHSRRHLGALARLGATEVGQAIIDGECFIKFRLETS